MDHIMGTKSVEIPFGPPLGRYFNKADREYGNYSLILDSQQEVTAGIELLFRSNDPVAQIYFQKYYEKELEDAGWQILSYFKDVFIAQLETYETIQVCVSIV